MNFPSVRWLQILLTLFYGQILSTALYEYFLQGLFGLILPLRPKCDAILLIILSVLMSIFVIYAIISLWFRRTRMSVIAMFILIFIFILTLVQSILELKHMGLRPIRLEWILIRTCELLLRLWGIAMNLIFLFVLRQGSKPVNFHFEQ